LDAAAPLATVDAMTVVEADTDIEAVARISAVPAILKLIVESFGLRLALVARVTEADWKACAVHDALGFGLAPGDRLELATTLCREVREAKKPIVIEHASADTAYCNHPTPKLYGFESYVSVPIFRSNGDYFGTLCGLDAKPIPLAERNALATMELFAQLVGLQLEAEERYTHTEAALIDARAAAQLREQFIAVLGHDLRNPLAAVLTGSEVLLARDLPDTDRRIVERIRASGRRMKRLIEDVLDLARGRLGGGIGVEHGLIEDLGPTIQEVVEELRMAHPGREIRVRVDRVKAIRGDRGRLAQLCSNLLANALQHGHPEQPIDVEVTSNGAELLLSVTNRGEPIPEDVRAQLFQPYFRTTPGTRRMGGLGLGLYIVSEIVRSHGGTIELTSTREEGTRFRCIIPHGT